MTKESSSNGVGFLGLLCLLLIGLKLAGFINWSWWWVLLPIYGKFVLYSILYVFYKIIKRRVEVAETKRVLSKLNQMIKEAIEEAEQKAASNN